MRSLVLLFFVFVSLPVHAAALRVECPEVVGIGLPFTVRVFSDQPLARIRVEWGGHVLHVPGKGATNLEFLLGTDVLKSKPGTERLRIAKLGFNPVVVESFVLIEDRDFPEQHLTVTQEMVSPPAKVQDRIARENALVRDVLGTVTPDRFLSLPLVRPVPGEVTSAYGLKRFFNGQSRNPHRGVDLRAAQGEAVLAAAAGRVALAAEHYYAGRCVYIDHGLGVFTVYMHLDEVLAHAGQSVEAGQLIGRAGMSGRVTGPHLHFGMSILDLAVDPSDLFFPALSR